MYGVHCTGTVYRVHRTMYGVRYTVYNHLLIQLASTPSHGYHNTLGTPTEYKRPPSLLQYHHYHHYHHQHNHHHHYQHNYHNTHRHHHHHHYQHHHHHYHHHHHHHHQIYHHHHQHHHYNHYHEYYQHINHPTTSTLPLPPSPGIRVYIPCSHQIY